MEDIAILFNNVFQKNKTSVATAESCTSGLVASCITSVPGASVFFKGGIVAYSNDIKEQVLGVRPETLEAYGAVSEETVTEMVRGAQRVMNARCAMATSGIAGPGGGLPEKPVGTIWTAVAMDDKLLTFKLTGDRGREENIRKTVRFVMMQLLKLASGEEIK